MCRTRRTLPCTYRNWYLMPAHSVGYRSKAVGQSIFFSDALVTSLMIYCNFTSGLVPCLATVSSVAYWLFQKIGENSKLIRLPRVV